MDMKLRKCVLFCLFFGLVFGLVKLAAADEPAQKTPAKLERLQAFWSAARVKVLDPINTKYA
ncbi:MAG: hypothetical protein KAG66_17145, partial [Methylococcales bacterium]|nr:hypothetical protein [Methylococcales bacterium]